MRVNRQQPELWTSCPHDSAITADSRHTSKGTNSQGTCSPSPFTGRFRKSRIIKKVDMSTLLARTEPIPKWITIKEMDIHSPIPGRRVSSKPSKQESAPQMPSSLPVERSEFAAKHNLMPLAELEKVMFDESNKAVVDGLFQRGNEEPRMSRVNALHLAKHCTLKSHHAGHPAER
ncbi:hypothetical protein MHU86_16224 [Fragilaria crotonensis]|nr:hypothetical protein MHU86_16224 [Fragilaria crotonensis]